MRRLVVLEVLRFQTGGVGDEVGLLFQVQHDAVVEREAQHRPDKGKYRGVDGVKWIAQEVRIVSQRIGQSIDTSACRSASPFITALPVGRTVASLSDDADILSQTVADL